jgi:hypothetical protein
MMFDNGPNGATETGPGVRPGHCLAPSRETIRWREDGAGRSEPKCTKVIDYALDLRFHEQQRTPRN